MPALWPSAVISPSVLLSPSALSSRVAHVQLNWLAEEQHSRIRPLNAKLPRKHSIRERVIVHPTFLGPGVS